MASGGTLSRTYITCTWDQVGHLDAEQKEEMFSALPPHQRDARSKGIPSLGSGAIYPVPESEFVISPIVIPKHWKHVYGMDVGWRNTAAVFAAIDPDNDILYITTDYKRGAAEPTIHAGAIKARAKGDKKPGVIDPASKGRSQIDGEQLIVLYRQLGLNIQPANNAVEAGIYAVWERISTGRLKVFNTCTQLLEEYRIYRRDEKGKIIKDFDHCLDGLRYLCMSGIQLAKPENPVKKKIVNTVVGSWMGR